jgi:hypothetical protein
MHTNTGRQTRQKLREPLQRAQRLYFFYFHMLLWIFMFLWFSDIDLILNVALPIHDLRCHTATPSKGHITIATLFQMA